MYGAQRVVVSAFGLSDHDERRRLADVACIQRRHFLLSLPFTARLFFYLRLLQPQPQFHGQIPAEDAELSQDDDGHGWLFRYDQQLGHYEHLDLMCG